MPVPALHALPDGESEERVLSGVAGRIRGPGLRGEEMFAKSRDALGTGNIPRDEMWRLHTDRARARSISTNSWRGGRTR